MGQSSLNQALITTLRNLWFISHGKKMNPYSFSAAFFIGFLLLNTKILLWFHKALVCSSLLLNSKHISLLKIDSLIPYYVFIPLRKSLILVPGHFIKWNWGHNSRVRMNFVLPSITCREILRGLFKK